MTVLACAILIILTPLPVGAATYYVAKSGGSDLNGCAQAKSLSTPKRTISAGQSCLTQPGDELHIRAGTYDERVKYTTLGAGGSQAKPIVIRGYQNERPVLMYTGTETCRGILLFGGSRSWITYRNLKIDGATTLTCTTGVAVDKGSTGVTFKDIEIADAPGSNLFAGDRLLLEDLYIHGTGWRAQLNGYKPGSNGIYAVTTNSVIRRNRLINNQCAGIRVFNSGTAYAATDNVIEFNYAERNGVGKGLNGTSICPAASFIIGDKRNILRHNIGDDGGARCIWLFNSGLGTADNKIHNNTCTRHPYGVVFDSNTTILNTLVANNLLVGNTQAAIAGTGSGTTFSNNITTGALTDYTVSSTNFALKSGSPAIGAGIAIAGNSLLGFKPDVGALQTYQAVSAKAEADLIYVTYNSKFKPLRVLPGAASKWKVNCSPSCGTLSVSGVSVAAGSDAPVVLKVSGYSGGGCAASKTISLDWDGSSHFITDSINIGGTLYGAAYNQPAFSLGALAVNTSQCSGAGPKTPMAPSAFAVE